MSNRILYIVMCMTLNIGLQAQDRTVEKAYDNFEKFNYDGAIQELEKQEVKSTDVKRKIAHSALKINDLETAEKYFSELSVAEDKEAEDILLYAEVLKMNNKYSVAQEQMEAYAKLAPEDSRGLKHLENEGYQEELMIDEGQFVVKNLEINTADEDFGTSYLNSKVVFASSREGSKVVKRKWNWNNLPFLDLYEAEVDSSLEFTSIKPHNSELNKKYHEGPATFSNNGDYKVFTRNNYDGTDSEGLRRLKMYEASYANDKWGQAVGLPWNSDAYSSGHATLSADGNTMYFASDMPGGHGGADIYASVRNETGDWATPTNLGPEVNSEGDELFPFCHESGLLLFASNGHLGLGGLDMFYAQVGQAGAASSVTNVGAPINSNRDDFAMIISTDMASGYFSSNREGGKGDDDIYSFDMLKPFDLCTRIEGVTVDEAGNILPGTTVLLVDEKGELVESISGDENGAYNFCVDSGNEFNIFGTKENYFGGVSQVEIKAANHNKKTVIVVERDPGLSLYGLIYDDKTNEPIDGVTIVLTDKHNKSTTTYHSSESGEFSAPLEGKQINEEIDYDIKLEKLGYLSKYLSYQNVIDQPGRFDVHEENDMNMTKFEVGMDVSNMIKVNPIYFDIASAELRPESTVELQKIVNLMNDFPTMVIELGSHTDCRAHSGYNMRLSDQRAKASAAWIRERIEGGDRIYGKGYGESQLVNDCGCGFTDEDNKICSEEAHQMNRRTEFKIQKL